MINTVREHNYNFSPPNWINRMHLLLWSSQNWDILLAVNLHVKIVAVTDPHVDDCNNNEPAVIISRWSSFKLKVMSDLQKDKTKTSKGPSEASHGVRGKETTGKTKEWARCVDVVFCFSIICVLENSSYCTLLLMWRSDVMELYVFQLHQYCVLHGWTRTPWWPPADAHNNREHLPAGWGHLHHCWSPSTAVFILLTKTMMINNHHRTFF